MPNLVSTRYVSKVHAVSTFYTPAAEAANGLPSWGPLQIIGPQNTPSVCADSRLSWSPSSTTGTIQGTQSGADEYFTFEYDTWASYLQYGFTEFIEVTGLTLSPHPYVAR